MSHSTFFPNKPEQQKTIFLISTPRSASTAFWNCVANMPNIRVVHEPGVYAYNKTRQAQLSSAEIRLITETLDPTLPTFEAVTNRINQLIKKEEKEETVFVKEMFFALKEYYSPFLANKNAYFFFLLRNPSDSILSAYRILNTPFSDMFAEAFDYDHFNQLHETIFQAAADRTFFIDSSALVDNSHEAIERFCSQAKIDFHPKFLTWEKLDARFEKGTCKPIPDCHFIEAWHGKAVASQRFDKNLLSQAKVDAEGKPTYEEMPAEHRAAYLAFYERQLPHFQLLSDKCAESQTHSLRMKR